MKPKLTKRQFERKKRLYQLALIAQRIYFSRRSLVAWMRWHKLERELLR